MADHQRTSATSVHRSSLFPFVLGFALLTAMTWLYHVLGPRIMVRAVSASRRPRFGTCCHLISRTVVLVANSSIRALRLGSLCKPTHKRRLWELCLSGALQILDLIDLTDWYTNMHTHTHMPGFCFTDPFLQSYSKLDNSRLGWPWKVNSWDVVAELLQARCPSCQPTNSIKALKDDSSI